MRAVGGTSAKMCGADVIAFVGQGADVAGIDQPGLLLALLDVLAGCAARASASMTGPTRAAGIFGRADLQAARRLDQPLQERIVDRFEHDDPRAGRALLAR